MKKTPKTKQNADDGSMTRLVRLPVVKWEMGRLREKAGEGWTSPLVWWVRETEAKQKLMESKMENQRLKDIIRRASTKFCEHGSDGAIAASMFAILGESLMANPQDQERKASPTSDCFKIKTKQHHEQHTDTND